MSHVASVWAWKQRAGKAKIVLLHLADEASRIGTVMHSSNDTMAERCECSARSVQRHIDDLETAGLIQIMRAGGRRAGVNVNAQYRLRYELDGAVDSLLTDADLKLLGRARMNPIRPEIAAGIGGDNLSPPSESGVTICPNGGDRLSPPTPLGVTICPIGGDKLSPIPVVTDKTTTTVREREPTEPVDNSASPEPVSPEISPPVRHPIQLPPLPEGIDPASLAIDDEQAERVVQEMLEMFMAEGYQRFSVATGRAIGILANWARGGLTPDDVRQRLTDARASANGPIKAPAQYLVTTIGHVRPKPARTNAPDRSEPPANVTRAAETEQARAERMRTLGAAGVRRREPESSEA